MRSKNFAKSFPCRCGFPANQYLKNNYPKQKSTTPPPPLKNEVSNEINISHKSSSVLKTVTTRK